MKNRRTHLLFWIGYWAFNTYLECLWLQNYVPGWTSGKMLEKAIAGAFFYMLPHLALAYFLVYFVLNIIVQKKMGPLKTTLLVLVAYAAAICLVIVIAHHIVLPHVYENVIHPAGRFVTPAKFVSILIDCGFPAGLLMAIQLAHTQMTAAEREKNLVKEKLSAELKLLKNQLNPHFLFNTLNNIYALARRKSDQAADTVMKLSELLSFMLYESSRETVAIEQEIKFLEDYIALEKIRYTEGLSVVFTRTIDDYRQPIAPLLLLPLVENAFKHGASENHFDSFIHISSELQHQQLLFIVENSFEEPVENRKPSNIGLYNTSRQLELIYREQKLVTSSCNGVFKVQLNVNLNSYGKI